MAALQGPVGGKRLRVGLTGFNCFVSVLRFLEMEFFSCSQVSEEIFGLNNESKAVEISNDV